MCAGVQTKDIMGCVYKNEITKAGRFLFNLLRNGDGVVDYSSFYDGTEETSKKMQFLIHGEEDDYVSVELLIDLAADQLKKHGVVKTTVLDVELADGEQDYRIELTEFGRASDCAFPQFHDVDL